MNSQIMPLRYRICDIHDLSKCKSNNSRDLFIRVSEFHSEKLTGTRITLAHRAFGPLFTYVLDAKGSNVTELQDYDDLDISMKQVLAQFERFGFLIEFTEEFHISKSQVEYLETLLKLKYDKIRILSVWSMTGTHQHEDLRVVAFQVNPLGDWLNNAYSPSSKEYRDALDRGVAINLTDISNTQNFRWDWLKGKVLSIEDVLRDNAYFESEGDENEETPAHTEEDTLIDTDVRPHHHIFGCSDDPYDSVCDWDVGLEDDDTIFSDDDEGE